MTPASLAIILQAVAATLSAPAPNQGDPHGRERDVKEMTEEALRHVPKLSSRIDHPTAVTADSVESWEKVRDRFQSLTRAANAAAMVSYLDQRPLAALSPGCAVTGIHPQGVERISDHHYNGLALLLRCEGHWHEVEVTDYTQPLSQIVQFHVPDDAPTIGDARLVRTFARAPDGRWRLTATALGRGTSIRVVSQSVSGSLPETIDAEQLDVIHRLLAAPLVLNP
jgi:hypothetical protein